GPAPCPPRGRVSMSATPTERSKPGVFMRAAYQNAAGVPRNPQTWPAWPVRTAQIGLPRPRQPLPQQPSRERGQPRTLVGIPDLFNGFRLSRVRVDRLRDRAEAELADHRQREFCDHLPGVGGDHGGPDNAVAAILYEYFDKPL